MMRKWLTFCLTIALLCGSMNGAWAENMQFETETIVFEIDFDEEFPRYNAVVAVRNTGDCALYLGYTGFYVTDAQNCLIAVEESSAVYALPSIVYPGETGYYCAASLDLPVGIDSDEEYHLVYDVEAIQSADASGIEDYEVINVSLPDQDYTHIIGEIVNGSDVGDVDVWCVCYDENGDIVTVGGTFEEMKTSHNTYFQILNNAAWEREDIADCTVMARMHYYPW